MRKFCFAVCLLFFAPAAYAQHTVTLNWTLSTADITANCTAAGSCHQTVYRAAGTCSATSTFVSLAEIAATQATYADTGVPNGVWCYGVSFTEVAAAPPESSKDTITVSLRPAQPPPPTGIKATGT